MKFLKYSSYYPFFVEIRNSFTLFLIGRVLILGFCSCKFRFSERGAANVDLSVSFQFLYGNRPQVGVDINKHQVEENLLKPYNLNFGPQHPARHGVLRIILTLDGERILSADPHIGLLHRGTEKLIEYKTSYQSLPYIDRLDYVSMIANEHTFAIALESLREIQVPLYRQYARVLFLEITRLLNHLIAVTTHRIDVGALTPFLWAFEEREKLLEVYEGVSGARMHANWIRPGGVASCVPQHVYEKIITFLIQFGGRLDEIEELLTENRIWIRRTRHVGILTAEEALSLGCSGVILRSTGYAWDLRKVAPYEVYSHLGFTVPVGLYGDCYDRFILRLYEIRESVNIIKYRVEYLLSSSENRDIEFASYPMLSQIKLTVEKRAVIKVSIEGLVHHFKIITENIILPRAEVIINTEAPKGEFGVFRVSDFSNRLYRLSIKAPGLLHLFSTNILSTNALLADLVAIIGTEDIVFGEVDR